jgi:glycosyltransferase involved in cell wall biosynthesis
VRVGISLLTLSPGDAGGSETYARQLIGALGRVKTHDYVVLVPARAKDAADGLPSVEVRDPPVGKRGPLRIATMALAARRTKAVTTQVAEFDVLHYPLTVPTPSTQAPTVVTLHDTQHRDMPEFFGPARRSFRRLAYDRAARSAAAVVVTSEFVRGRAVELLGLASERVHVVPHAIDHSVFTRADEEPEPMILYPARPWPHKNHPRLFEAFAMLRETRPKLRLVLTGGGLERLAPLPEGVESLGSVSPEHLASLYRRAACLVFPSLYEGFGLPVLEAMACGCPVAASNAGAIPEVAGDAAVLFDPTDVTAMAEAMLEADRRRDELTTLGVTRASRYTWDETARRHEDVYTAAVSGVPAGTPTTP